MSIGEQSFGDPTEDWPEPDLSLIAGRFLKPPAFPVEIFGAAHRWVEEAAAASNAPIDYISGSLLATASALIGNTRKARAWGGYMQCAAGERPGTRSVRLGPSVREESVRRSPARPCFYSHSE